MQRTKGKGNVTVLREGIAAEAVRDDLSRRGWQWFLTANTPVFRDCVEVEQWKRLLVKLLMQQLGLMVAAKGVWLRWPCSHFHILFSTTRTDGRLFKPTQEEVWGLMRLRFGIPGYDGLHSVRYRKVQSKWRGMTGGRSLRILPVYDARRLANYIAGVRNVARPGQYCEYLAPVNARLLRRMGL